VSVVSACGGGRDQMDTIEASGAKPPPVVMACGGGTEQMAETDEAGAAR
jgi:hypothetical protein